MLRRATVASSIGQDRNHRSWRSRPLAALLLLSLALATHLLRAQTPGKPCDQTYSLPATTGEPLTIAPVDLPDIDCSIREWNAAPPKPLLTLLCPPEAVFAPLRVYLRLSWMKPEDVPTDVGRIIVQPTGWTKIRTNRTAVMVRLDVARETGQNPRPTWVSFNGVVDVALIKDSPRP